MYVCMYVFHVYVSLTWLQTTFLHHTNIHTYTHTYIHTIRSSINTHTHTYIHKYCIAYLKQHQIPFAHLQCLRCSMTMANLDFGKRGHQVLYQYL